MVTDGLELRDIVDPAVLAPVYTWIVRSHIRSRDMPVLPGLEWLLSWPKRHLLKLEASAVDVDRGLQVVPVAISATASSATAMNTFDMSIAMALIRAS